jgi:uncharacterized protein
MPSRYFLDSNIFLRTIVNDVPAMALDCRELLFAVSSGRLEVVTSSLVLVEVSWVLQSFYKLAKADMLEMLQSMASIKGLTIVEQTSVAMALSFYERYAIKFADCVIASYPEVSTGKTILVSYDKEFDKLPGVKRMEPQEVMSRLKGK